MRSTNAGSGSPAVAMPRLRTLLGHGDRRVLVVVVVGAERHDDAAGDVVGEEVLQLAEERGLRPAELAGVAAPHLRQIARRLGRDVELVAIDVQLRRRLARLPSAVRFSLRVYSS